MADVNCTDFGVDLKLNAGLIVGLQHLVGSNDYGAIFPTRPSANVQSVEWKRLDSIELHMPSIHRSLLAFLVIVPTIRLRWARFLPMWLDCLDQRQNPNQIVQSVRPALFRSWVRRMWFRWTNVQNFSLPDGSHYDACFEFLQRLPSCKYCICTVLQSTQQNWSYHYELEHLDAFADSVWPNAFFLLSSGKCGNRTLQKCAFCRFWTFVGEIKSNALDFTWKTVRSMSKRKKYVFAAQFGSFQSNDSLFVGCTVQKYEYSNVANITGKYNPSIWAT